MPAEVAKEAKNNLAGDVFRSEATSSFQQKPLTILLLQITAIALFYVAIVAALLIERQAAEIALLRSRGASMPQVLLLFLIQGLLIGIPVILAAPFLAAGATAILGLTPLFSNVSNGDLLPVTVPPLAFAMGTGGVVLSLVAFIVPGAIVAMKSATENAESIMKTLQQALNKARQESITQELVEMASAKDAMAV